MSRPLSWYEPPEPKVMDRKLSWRNCPRCGERLYFLWLLVEGSEREDGLGWGGPLCMTEGCGKTTIHELKDPDE